MALALAFAFGFAAGWFLKARAAKKAAVAGGDRPEPGRSEQN